MKRILTILLLAVSLTAQADKWYIATAANGGSDTDGDGSITSPWLTLKHAADTVTGATFVGDTIVVGAGTFIETAQSAIGVGVSLYGAGTTSIITTSAALNPIILLSSASENTNGNQSISNIAFDGNSLTALRAIGVIARTNVRVRNCTFDDFLNSAVTFDGATVTGNKPTTFATGNEFTNNTVDNCANYTTYGTGALWYNGTSGIVISDNIMTQTSRGSGDNGYLIKGRYNKGELIHDNYLERAVDNQPYHFTIELWDGEGGTQIYDNTSVGGAIDVAGYYFVKGAYSFSCDVFRNVMRLNNTNTLNTTDYPTWAIVVEGGAEDVIVRQNLMQNFNYPIGISVLQPATVMNRVTFYANVVWNWGNSATNHGAAVLVGADPDNGTMRNIGFYNNTFYDDGASFDPPYVIWFNATGGTFEDWRFENNICIGGATFFFRTQANSGTPTFDTLIIRNNIQYGNGYSNEPYYDASFTPSNITYSGAVKSDPLFVSSSDLHLQSTSPAIDVGTDVGSAYIGLYPDLGAYEYGNSSNVFFTKPSPDGSDSNGDGSIWNPWATVSFACTQVTSGDTVYVTSGEYSEASQIVRPVGVHIYGAGDSSHIISTYTNASATQASIQCSSSSGTITHDGGSISYIRLTGSSLTAYYGINVGYRSHVSIHHVTLEDFLNGGIWLLASSSFGSLYATGNSITNCVINNSSGRTADRYPACIRLTGQDSCDILNNSMDMRERAAGQNGNTIEFQRCKHTKIDGNTFYRTNHELNYWNFFFEGWDYGGDLEYTNNIHYGLAKVSFGGEYNRQEADCSFGFKATDNKFINPSVGYRTVGGYDQTAYCINVEGDGHINGFVQRNYIQNYGVGIELSTPESGVGYWHHYWDWDSIVVSHNIIDGIGYQDHAYAYGIWWINETNLYPYYGVFNNVTIANNTIIAHDGVTYDGYQGIGIYANDTINSLRISNNIAKGFSNYGIYISEHATDTLVIDGLDASHNCMNGNGTNTVYVESAAGRITITNSDVTTGNITTDPLFVSTSDLHLQSTSPCRDAGIDVSAITGGLDFHGAALYGASYDIGAFEYGINRMLLIGTTIPIINYKIQLIDH